MKRSKAKEIILEYFEDRILPDFKDNNFNLGIHSDNILWLVENYIGMQPPLDKGPGLLCNCWEDEDDRT